MKYSTLEVLLSFTLNESGEHHQYVFNNVSCRFFFHPCCSRIVIVIVLQFTTIAIYSHELLLLSTSTLPLPVTYIKHVVSGR